MTRHEAIPAPFPDDFGIGQEKVAKIQMELAMKGMADSVNDAFSTGYVNPLWRAAKRRIFYRNRAEYERAKTLLEVLQ